MDLIDIKMEPTFQSIGEQQTNNVPYVEHAIPPKDVTQNLWTSKATTRLINQYKKHISKVGQTSRMKSLRDMFVVISLEMQKYGFNFSPQKCENKWRVLVRKYKALVHREYLKEPGKMRHYGKWEHKRALDEILNDKKHVYLERNNSQSSSELNKYPVVLLERGCEQGNLPVGQQYRDFPKATTNEKNEETADYKKTLTILFENFAEEMKKNFAMAERNKERRHKEEMAIRQQEIELTKQLLKLKQQKVELQRCQILAAAQNLHI